MRFFYTLFLIVISTIFSFAQQLTNPSTSAPLYAHLYEVNPHWITQSTPPGWLEEVQFRSDIDRIQKHLELVEKKLRQRPVDHLSPLQQKNRLTALDALHYYWQKGRFPRNEHHSVRTSYFVDDHGTACAVGQLMLESGDQKIVERIRQENNYAKLEELLAYNEVKDWASCNGFTAEELAWIQPAYSVVYFEPQAFGDDLGLEGGIVYDMEVYENELYFAGDFSTIDGFPANCIAAWDGESLRAIPGLEGKVEHLEFDKTTGDMYVLGILHNFASEPGQVLLARYRNEAWEPLINSTDLDSSNFLTDLICRNGNCYVSGNITKLFDQEMEHLTVFDIENDSWEKFSEAVTITDMIYDIDLSGDSLMIGCSGAIVENGDTVSTLVGLLDLNNRNSLYIPSPSETHSPGSGTVAGIINGRFMAVFSTPEGPMPAYVFSGDDWFPGNEILDIESEIFGYYKDRHLLYGWFDYNFGYENPYIFASLPGASASALWNFVRGDSAVTAMIDFQGELIMAGKFTELDGVPVNNLARTFLLITDEEEVPETPQLEVSTDGQTIFIKNIPATAEETSFELFDMQGRLVWQSTIPFVGTTTTLQPRDLPSGTYAYRALIDGQPGVGQVVLVK